MYKFKDKVKKRKCLWCNYNTFSTKRIIIHYKNIHNVGTDDYIKIYTNKEVDKVENFCIVCHKLFINKSNLIDHLKSNHNYYDNKIEFLKSFKNSKGVLYNKKQPKKSNSWNLLLLKKIISNNDSYCEFDASIFIKSINEYINPNMFIYSWDNKKLKEPFFVEVNILNKNLSSMDKINKIKNLERIHPVLQIWGESLDFNCVEKVIVKFILKKDLFSDRGENVKLGKSRSSDRQNSAVTHYTIPNILA